MQSINVLVADDYALTRAILRKHFLAYSQFLASFDEVDDGQKAIEKISKKQYDLIILDIHMPKVSGLRVLQHIRESSSSSKVIMCSMANDVSTVKRVKEFGTDAYLLKPIKAELLNEVLGRLFPEMTLA